MSLPDIQSRSVELSNRLHEIEVEIKSLTRSATACMLTMGKLLSEIDERKLWRTTTAKGFDEYVLKELTFSRSTAYNMINAFRQFGNIIDNSPDLLNVEPTKLYRLLPTCSKLPDEQKEEWLHKAKVLPVRGLEEEIKVSRGKPDPAECEHVHVQYIEKCVDCNTVLSSGMLEE